MRTALVQTLLEMAADDPRVFLLTGDIGWSALEGFAQRFPRQFLNVGVAEQNLLGIATGLAKVGYLPFAYSIATFASMRPYEQFRDGAVLHQLPVRLIGMGGGFAYGHAGPTHFAVEDLALARTQPGLLTLAPADSAQTRALLHALRHRPEPAYVRLDKTEEPDLPGLEGRVAFETPELIHAGRDLLLVATGSIAREALHAAELLQATGLAAAVAVLAHVSFRSGPRLLELLRSFSHVVAVEEAFSAGGLGSLLAETIAEYLPACRLLRCGVTVPLDGCSGSRDYLRRRHGLDAASLAQRAHEFVRGAS